MKTVIVHGGPKRGADINRVEAELIACPLDADFEITISPYNPKLPHNLRARLKIPTRELAAFHGVSYNAMNEIIHDHFYPKVEKTIAGIVYDVSKDTNQLTPDEAREIEVNIIQWAVDTGCPLSIPQADS